MLRTILPLGLAVLVVATPAGAQDGNISMGAFVTIDAKDTEDFEEAAREHAQWHASQGDTWAWPAYASLGGGVEYAFVTSGHDWSDFDNPPVDMAADQLAWASGPAEYATSEEIAIWESLPEFGEPSAEPSALVQVIEFEVNPGGDAAVLHAMGKFKEAVDMGGGGGNFGWSRVVSNDGPPTYFVAVFADSFAELGAPGPNPEEIMTAAFGATEARMMGDAFDAAATVVSSRIWILRPDLSYMPN